MLQNEVILQRKQLLADAGYSDRKRQVISGWNMLADIAFIATEAFQRPDLAKSREAIVNNQVPELFEVHPEPDLDRSRWLEEEVDGLIVPNLAALTGYIHTEISDGWQFERRRDRLAELLGARVSFGMVNVWDDITAQYGAPN